ncbi:TPA: restriction endonuclease subunit S [Vibrio parahaemolyticus]|nr:restriction endonuclease subunit S [Vibrio parahaemolyticus]
MVPNGWLKTDLNPFIDIKHGFAFKSEYFREEGEYVLLTPGSFYEPGGFRDQKNKTKYYVGDIPKGYLLSKGELLVAMTEQAAGLLGSTLFVPSHDRYLHNQRLGLIQIKDKNGICPEFLYLTYNSPYVRKQIAEQSTGTKVKHTSPDKLKSVICLLPPLPEQRKIAKILSTWDKAISTAEKLIETSKQQKKALMQQLLTGKKRLVNPETGKAFEGEWEEVKVSTLITKHSEKTETNKQYPVLTSSRKGIYFQSDYYNDRDVASEDTTGYNVVPRGYFTYRHMSDDLVFKFNRNTICDKGIVSTLYPVFAAKEEAVVPYLLQAILNEGSAFKRFSLSQKQGGSRTYMYLSKLNELKIQIPSLTEQQKITSALTAADKEIEVLEAKLAHFKQEKKALMQQLLTGKRRVKVDEMEVA